MLKRFIAKLILHKNNTCKSFLVRRQMGTILHAIEEQDRKKYYTCCHICEETCFSFGSKLIFYIDLDKISINDI